MVERLLDMKPGNTNYCLLDIENHIILAAYLMRQGHVVTMPTRDYLNDVLTSEHPDHKGKVWRWSVEEGEHTFRGKEDFPEGFVRFIRNDNLPTDTWICKISRYNNMIIGYSEKIFTDEFMVGEDIYDVPLDYCLFRLTTAS